ncbi:oligomeric Golgi complex subunit 1-like [Planoprotostelium fungivorum]|uniref:Conserved oligomeric Golgi complex subunit 1 n=1 Tax=Planoprotostelium fungivorum TaxID=1890364 RepID=A0A2P6MVW1_9EUKA|nr:oligomeric Golgi complex subunit 1-like [Planoprotostelium fungivorum]
MKGIRRDLAITSHRWRIEWTPNVWSSLILTHSPVETLCRGLAELVLITLTFRTPLSSVVPRSTHFGHIDCPEPISSALVPNTTIRPNVLMASSKAASSAIPSRNLSLSGNDVRLRSSQLVGSLRVGGVKQNEPPVRRRTTITSNENLETTVNKLFNTLSVEEIRSKEMNMRKETEERRQELRVLVGARYRDLIDSADTIVEMRELSKEAYQKMNRVETGCKKVLGLREDSLLASTTGKMEEKNLRRGNTSTAKKIKILVDTPEQIWREIENNRYLEASQLYLRAKETHQSMEGASDAKTIASIHGSIPLLLHQWSTISQFPPKILESGRAHEKSGTLPVEQHSDTLASILLLSSSDLPSLCKEFLQSRLSCALDSLKSDSKASNQSGILQQLNSVVYVLQSSIEHTEILFTSDATNKRGAMINESLSKVGHKKEDLQLDRTTLNELTKAFIDQSCQQVRVGGGELLKKIESAKVLRDMEISLKSNISKEAELKTKTRGSVSLDSAAIEDSEWDKMCTRVCGTKVDLWEVYFRQLFVDRFKAIIREKFHSIGIQSKLKSVLSHVSEDKGSSEQDRHMAHFIWGTYHGAAEEEKNDNVRSRALGITKNLEEVSQHISKQLTSILHDITSSFEWQSGRQDTQMIKSYAQETCYEAMYRMSREIQECLGKDMQEELFVGRICRSIYHHSYSIEPLLRGSIYNTMTSQNSNPVRKSMRNSKVNVSGPPQQTKEMQKMLDVYKSLEYRSYMTWVKRIAEKMESGLRKSIEEDHWGDSTRKRLWEETKVSVENDGVKTEETVLLPFQCSQYVLNHVFDVCQEIDKKGGNFNIEKSVIQYLVYELSERVVRVYHEFLLSDQGSVISKEGVIQLFYDVFFLSSVFSCRKDIHYVQEQNHTRSQLGVEALGVEEGKSKKMDEYDQVIQWTNRINSLISKIKSHLDPIEVVFYEPHVTQSSQKFFRRSIVLLGSIIQSSKLPPQQPLKGKVGPEQHNLLILAPLPSRFALLPIGNPETESRKDVRRKSCKFTRG